MNVIPAALPAIAILPIGNVPAAVPAHIRDKIEEKLSFPTFVGAAYPLPAGTAIAPRGQHDAGALIDRLNAEADSTLAAVLGVTAVDLCLPIFTYVFGEAQINGRAAVVSTYRFGTGGGGGLGPMQLDRLAKVALHELGHVFSLPHCSNETCLMRFAGKTEDLDRAAFAFCDHCGFVLKKRSRKWAMGRVPTAAMASAP